MDIVDIIKIVSGLVAGLGLGWWLTDKIGLEITHSHRVIEEHTKKLHEYVEQHYLRVIATIEELEKYLKGMLEKVTSSDVPSDEEVEASLFFVARLTKQEEEWSRKVGGILLLRDRVGEAVVSRLVSRIDEQLFSSGILDRVDDAKIREQIDSSERLAKFKEKIEVGDLKTIAGKYKTNITSDANLLSSLVNCLRCLYLLFDYEINVCYRAWYKKKPVEPSFQQAEWDVVEDILNELQKEGKINSKGNQKYKHKLKLIQPHSL